MAEPFAETPQPCGQHGLIGRWFHAIMIFARDVGHAFDTRDEVRRDRGSSAAPEAARTILIGFR
jgi:hypothetical protein